MLAALSLLLAAYDKPTTAMCADGDRLFVGRADGAVEELDADLNPVNRYAKGDGKAVAFIAQAAGRIAWLSGPGGEIRDKVAAAKPAPAQLTIVAEGKRTVVRIQPTAPVRRLEWLQGHVGLGYDFGTTFFDTAGRVVAPSSFMPGDASALVPASSLWVRQQEDGTQLAVFAKPYSVRQNPLNQKEPLVSLFTAYQVGAWQWEKLGGFASTAFDAFPEGELVANEDGRLAAAAKFIVLSDRIALAPDGVVGKEADSLVSVPLFRPNWQSVRTAATPPPGDSLWMGASLDDAWWWTGSALVHVDRKTGRPTGYLPWIDPAMKPTCFAASGGGLWIGSNRGLRFLDPVRVDPKLGFAGFIRVGAAPESGNPVVKRLTDAVFAWRFVEADKAGADGGVMVASAFSAVGLQLPQTARGLMEAGTPVVDELRFGDVLVKPDGAAIYLGNSATVEVRGGRVQNGEIWAYQGCSVRRFLPSS